MSKKAVISVTVSVRVLDRMPPVGGLVLSPHPPAMAVKRVKFVRRLIGQNTAGKAKIGLESVRKGEVPEGVVIPPWPRLPLQGRESAAQAPPRRPAEIESPAKRARAQRQKIAALLADDRSHDRVVHPVRLANTTAVEGEWRDPEDLSVNRRTPRLIKGLRAFDMVEDLAARKSINRKQARAARRLRDQYDRGIEGVRLGYDRVQQAPGGFGPSDGPSGIRLEALEDFEAAKKAVGRSLWTVLAVVVIGNSTLKEFCRKARCHHYTGHERLVCALDRLGDFYQDLEEARRKAA